MSVDGPTGVALADVSPRLGLLYTGLSGCVRTIVAHADADDPVQFPDTLDTIQLPASAQGLDWYRAAIAHRALHDTLGSFEFRFEQAPALLPSSLRGVAAPVADGAGDFERVFALFGHRTLAEQIFTVLEDIRVEARTTRFRGLQPALRAARAAARDRFPLRAGATPRQALADALARLSLDDPAVAVPAVIAAEAAQVAFVCRLLRDPRSTVADTVEATVRVYGLVTRLPAIGPAEPAASWVRVPAATDIEPPDSRRWPDHAVVGLEGGNVLDVVVPPVDYRDVLWPRFLPHTPPIQHREAEIIRFLPPGAGHAAGESWHVDHHDGDHHDHHHHDEPEGLHPVAHEHNEPVFDDAPEAHGTLSPDGPGTFVYDEWDGFRRAYRRAWCRVRERRIAPGENADGYHAALDRHTDVLPALHALLAALRPERHQLVGRQAEGDEIDLDAATEALIDLRVTGSASDDVYLARMPVERDVALAALVDLSSSTAERVAATGDGSDDFRDRPRVLDLEMDSVALLAHLLDRVRDSFAVYGFSGRGRGAVTVDVFKEFHEQLTPGVLSRFARAVPVSGTRMGAAIRHATHKLREQSAQTRLLVVISDGRPYDRDYGQEYGEAAVTDYANRDVRAAVDEARAAGIRVFLLTVDKEGLDYLRETCGDGNYEVLDDVRQLPSRLLSLYGELVDSGTELAWRR
ncbi:VWA domain-containing protein [Phytohabitans sp. ZYX-F-186]|uniref:VWA domain-containing protein n=1 Tax=Phytohabitans maris TaxID=3071409 RepID=A0ABU0ZKI4_9ACTN|nr:VWA domain-containing protein [Phytohabitans sp. ZYX-F-186]MDQ7907561.1 VWA domain-containing protein [Phytohabitans sp. ZYX-F-186]